MQIYSKKSIWNTEVISSVLAFYHELAEPIIPVLDVSLWWLCCGGHVVFVVEVGKCLFYLSECEESQVIYSVYVETLPRVFGSAFVQYLECVESDCFASSTSLDCHLVRISCYRMTYLRDPCASPILEVEIGWDDYTRLSIVTESYREFSHDCAARGLYKLDGLEFFFVRKSTGKVSYKCITCDDD